MAEEELDLIATHLSKATPDLRRVYDKLEHHILAFGSDVIKEGRKHCITFIRGKNFVDIVVYPMQLNLYINMKKGSLSDPRKLAADVSRKGHWGNGDYVIIIRDSIHLKYVASLIGQSYKRN